MYAFVVLFQRTRPNKCVHKRRGNDTSWGVFLPRNSPREPYVYTVWCNAGVSQMLASALLYSIALGLLGYCIVRWGAALVVGFLWAGLLGGCVIETTQLLLRRLT